MKELFLRILEWLSNRIIWISFVLIVLFAVIFVSLYRIQIINQSHYEEMALEQQTDQTVLTVRPVQERGLIYDRTGRVLAANEESLTLYYVPEAYNENLADALVSVSRILKQYGIPFSYDQDFPLIYSKEKGFRYQYAFDETVNEINHLNFLAEVYDTSRDDLSLEQRRTNAADAFSVLYRDTFGLPEEASLEERIELCSVRYAIFSGRFSPEEPVRIARGIPEEMMVRVLERPELFRGFVVRSEYERVYPEGSLFAHVVGYVGRISEDELSGWSLDGESYAPDAIVGKTGIELAYENELAKGENVYLTIDVQMQQQAYDALEKQIRNLLVAKITGVPSENGETYTVTDVFSSLVRNRVLKDSMRSSGLPMMEQYLETAREASGDWLEELEENVLSNVPVKDYSPTLKAIYDLMITVMRDEKRLSYQYQQDEDFYVPYAAGEKGAYDLFSHALSHVYIPSDAYGLTESQSQEEQIKAILSYEIRELQSSEAYQLLAEQRMIQDGWFSQIDMLLLFYEQGILSSDDGSETALREGELTVQDLLIQKIREGALSPQQIDLDPCSGSAVISDPFSGEVLAMVSYPTFDPMRFMQDNEYYNDIVLDLTGPLSFRAVYEARAIGSTYKMCTAITALELGNIDENTKIMDNYAFPDVNSVDQPHCWSAVSHGEINVAQALDHSCNYFFYQLGYTLCEPNEKHEFDDSVGLKKMANFAKRLGLAEPTGIEIGETVPVSSDIDAVRSAIGQGTNAFTAANINRYTCTLANGGDVYGLYMVDAVKSPGGETFYLADGAIDHDAEISDKTIETVLKGMRLVVTDEHKAEFADLEAMNIHAAGKTGTVQESEDRPDHSLFTGYTTVENPEIVVTVMIPFGGGSHNAIPVFIDIVQSYYRIFS